jgi:hypothetical protein
MDVHHNTLDPTGDGWRPNHNLTNDLPTYTLSPGFSNQRDPRSLKQEKRFRNSSNKKNRNATSGFTGRVYGFQTRSDRDSLGDLQVWTFRVVRYDEFDNRLPLPPVIVEMRGRSFEGFINDNDEVFLTGRWREGDVLRTEGLYNVTTGTPIVVKDPLAMWKWPTRILNAFALLFLFGLVFVALVFVALLIAKVMA